jgi:hypothetical protein
MLCVYSKINTYRGLMKNKKIFSENILVEKIILIHARILRY